MLEKNIIIFILMLNKGKIEIKLVESYRREE